MQVQDYKQEGLFGDSTLNGLAVSVLLHAGAVFLMVIVPFMLPRTLTPPPLCIVDLLVLDMAGGVGGGEAGAMRAGDGKPEPPAPEEPEEEVETKPEKADGVYLSKVVDPPETPPPVEKKIEKPKPKPKPIRVQKLKPKPESTARNHSDPEAGRDRTTEAPASEYGKGPGTETGTGTGLAAAGSGTGTGQGSGAGLGTGGGPLDAAFGSGNGPRFTSKALPKYPRLARELGKEGMVLLRLTIDERGRLMEVEVLKPAGSGFDEEAVKAVRESSFSPARIEGKPIRCRAQLPIRFVLSSADKD